MFSLPTLASKLSFIHRYPQSNCAPSRVDCKRCLLDNSKGIPILVYFLLRINSRLLYAEHSKKVYLWRIFSQNLQHKRLTIWSENLKIKIFKEVKSCVLQVCNFEFILLCLTGWLINIWYVTIGDRATCLYVVMTGCLILFDTSMQPYAKVESGNCFGEVAAMKGSRQSATAITDKRTSVWQLPIYHIEALKDSIPLNLRKIRCMSFLADELSFHQYLTVTRLPRYEIVASRGTKTDTLYYILEGQIVMDTSHNRLMAKSFFGYEGLLDGNLDMVFEEDFIAECECKILTVTAEGFNSHIFSQIRQFLMKYTAPIHSADNASKLKLGRRKPRIVRRTKAMKERDAKMFLNVIATDMENMSRVIPTGSDSPLSMDGLSFSFRGLDSPLQVVDSLVAVQDSTNAIFELPDAACGFPNMGDLYSMFTGDSLWGRHGEMLALNFE